MPLSLGLLAAQKVKVAVTVAGDYGSDPGLHAVEVVLAPAQVTGVAGSVTGAAAHALTGGAGAVEIDIGGDALKEGGEAVRVADALAQGLTVGMIGMAQAALPGVQFVGTRLARAERARRSGQGRPTGRCDWFVKTGFWRDRLRTKPCGSLNAQK